jgi:hypothetical protein
MELHTRVSSKLTIKAIASLLTFEQCEYPL